MDNLQEARARIDQIDNEMARLFEERMNAVRAVALYKQETGGAVFDPEREKEILSHAGERISDPALAPYYRDFQEGVMRVSRTYQHKTLDDLYVKTREGGYPITICRGAIHRVGTLFNLNRRVLVVSDSGVPNQYIDTVAAQCNERVVAVVPKGESSKSYAVLEKLHRILLTNGFTRGDCVVAVGGGMVGDLAAFAAATYMRGIDFYNVPTTLLSQVDSSVGGKTAINVFGTKNAVGAFWQPCHVVIDPDVLGTLPQREWNSGLAEVIKMAATHDKDLFERLENENIRENIASIIRRAVEIKREVVEQDEKEAGARRALNFGHTIGHGIESCAHGLLRHGECVAMGTLQVCSPEVRERLAGLYTKVGIPLRHMYKTEDILLSVHHDKKAVDGGITLVWVEELGSFVCKTMTWEEFDAMIQGGTAE